LEKPAWSEAEDGLRKCSDNTVCLKREFTCSRRSKGLMVIVCNVWPF
jgi:hypothetical protein